MQPEITVKTIRIGTRGSLLATTQTEWVVQKLRLAHPGIQFVTEVVQTTGDLQRGVPFASVGTKGMFVKEIEQALLDGSIDIGIHSCKDMPGTMPTGLALTCIPEREDSSDCLISWSAKSIYDLKLGAIVGTSSARRKAQLLAFRSDLNIQELRGNLDTRIRKLQDAQYDAIVVASAGIRRLELTQLPLSAIPFEICLPAVGQGALAVQSREDDAYTNTILESVSHAESYDCVTTERSLLAALGGGCSVPIAAHAFMLNGTIELSAMVCSLDGRTTLKAQTTGNRSTAFAIGLEAANQLLESGAKALIQNGSL